MKNINLRDIGRIEISIMKKDINLFKELLNEHLECLHYSDDSIGTLLHVAAENGNIEAMKYLISLGIDINKCGGTFNANALIAAISSKQFEATKFLLNQGIEIDMSDSLRNPLLAAIDTDQIEYVKFFIDKGIDVNKTYIKESGEKLTALLYAENYASEEIIDLIKDAVIKSGGNIEENTQNEDELINHIEKYLGSITDTISQVLPNAGIDFNINIIRPTKEKGYITLVTDGMSSDSMDYSENDNEEKYAEIIMKLPSDWKLTEESLREERYVWPIKLMSKIAYIAHSFSGYISENVIIPNGVPGDVPLPYHADTWLSSAMVCKAEEIPALECNEEKRVDFFTIVPICDEEEDDAKRLGSNEFMHTLPLRDVVDEERGYEE